MFAKTVLSMKAVVVMMLMVCALAMGAFLITAPVASAQVGNVSVTNATTIAQLQALINSLIVQLQALQAQVGTTTPPVVPPVLPPVVAGSTTIPIGSSITTTDKLNVRGEPGLNAAFIEVKPAGSKGVVVEGPVRRDGAFWYKVDYETGADGWNNGGWLRLRTDLADVLGNYVAFKDGVIFEKVENVNRLEATSRCKLKAAENSSSVFRCTWKGAEIFVSTDVKETPRINNATLPVNSSEVTVGATFSVSGVGTTSSSTNVGKINWGDGSGDETVYAKVTSGLATARIKHKYATVGRFTITVTGLDGKTDVETVVVTRADVASTTLAKINTFTITPNKIAKSRNGQRNIALNWSSTGTQNCSLYEQVSSGNRNLLLGNQASSGAYTLTPVWASSSTATPKEYVVKCKDATKNLFVEKTAKVSLVANPTATTTAPVNASTTASSTVLGASTDIFSEIAATLSAIKALIK